MTENISFQSTSALPEHDAAVIKTGLLEFNADIGKTDEVVPLSIVARDESNDVVGGLLARTWGTCCEVMILWVRDDCRKQGVGTQLMADVERDAIARGCDLIYLDTMSFQAPDFYASLGYQTNHVISGYPRGLKKIYMSKPLVSPPSD